MIAAIGEGVNTLELYERIRLLRKDYLHMSQTEFGIKLGVSRSVIKNIELDALARPDQKLSLIKLMCKEFFVNEEWLLHGSMPMFVTPDTFSLDQYLKEKGCTELEMEIVKAYFELDADTRQKIFEAFERIHSRIATAKEQLAAADAATAGGPPEVKAPQEMTVAELHAELDRQIAEEKKRTESGSASGRGNSETATG